MLLQKTKAVLDVYRKLCRKSVLTVLIFLGRGTGVSAVPAVVPLVSSAGC